MKNILYIHSGAELYGADIVLLNLLSGIDKEKYNVHVILPSEGPLLEKMKSIGINAEVIPYPILRRQFFNIKGIISYVFQYRKYSKMLEQKVKEYNIDIVHVNTIAVLEGIHLKRKQKVKIVWHIHEILENPKIVVKFLSKAVAKYADVVVAVSNAVKVNLEKYANFKDKIKVVYNGVDNEVFNSENETQYLKDELHIPEDAKIVGMIGRINHWKGQKDFIKASLNLLEKYSNLYIVLVGGVFEGQEWRKKELEEYIMEQKNSSRIILLDFREDSKNIHNLFDIFILPSTEPDPLPTVVLEAMATGKPIVGYEHGGICEMVEKNVNGYLVQPNNIEALSQAIDKMLNSDYKSMGEKSYLRQSKYFSLNSYIENFDKIYEGA